MERARGWQEFVASRPAVRRRCISETSCAGVACLHADCTQRTTVLSRECLHIHLTYTSERTRKATRKRLPGPAYDHDSPMAVTRVTPTLRGPAAQQTRDVRRCF
eukprot:21271-Prymnesium_polylepis.1